jgi:hypothetical protein
MSNFRSSNLQQWGPAQSAGPTPPIYPSMVGVPNAFTTGTQFTPQLDQRTGQPKVTPTREEINDNTFGVYTKQPRTPADQLWANELRDYPDALADGMTMLGMGDRDQTQTLITILTEADVWLLRDIMPLEAAGDRSDIEWDEVQFNDTAWNRLPEESIGTYMTDSRRSYRESLVRWGKNAAITRTFYKTPVGKKAWFMKMWQMSNGLIQMMQYGIMTALMDSRAIDKQDEVFNDSTKPPRSVMDCLAVELSNFARFNKAPDSAFLTLDQLEKQFKSQVQGARVAPDTLIVPQNTLQHFRQYVQTEKNFMETGLKQGQAPPTVTNLFQGYKIYESLAMKLGDFLPGQFHPHSK